MICLLCIETCICIMSMMQKNGGNHTDYIMCKPTIKYLIYIQQQKVKGLILMIVVTIVFKSCMKNHLEQQYDERVAL